MRVFKAFTVITFCITVILFGLKFARNKINSNFNLIIISIDTTRADHMGIYGYKNDTTPNIDAWAKKATVFTDTYTAVPLTIPSFTAFFTGVHPFLTSVSSNDDGNVLDFKTKTTAEVLKSYKFNTTAFVANTVFSIPKPNMLERGFDQFNYYKSMDSQDTDHSHITTDVINWLKKQSKNRFFLWVHYSDPHGPYNPRNDLRCKFDSKLCAKIDSKSYKQWEDERLKTYQDLGMDTLVSQGCPINIQPPKNLDVFESLYDGEIAADDEEIGKILDTIKATHLDKKTIVVFYGDHGEGFDHEYFFTHGGVPYNGSIRIPLIIAYPGNKAPKPISDRFILNTDISSTLLSLLGIKFLNKDSTGENFVDEFPDFYNTKTTKREEAYLLGFNVYTILNKTYKYSNYMGREVCTQNRKREELYNIKNDPDEKINLVSTNPETSDKLRKSLIDKLNMYGYPPSNNLHDTDALEKLKSLGY